MSADQKRVVADALAREVLSPEKWLAIENVAYLSPEGVAIAASAMRKLAQAQKFYRTTGVDTPSLFTSSSSRYNS